MGIDSPETISTCLYVIALKNNKKQGYFLTKVYKKEIKTYLNLKKNKNKNKNKRFI
jgi:hypothetical protein